MEKGGNQVVDAIRNPSGYLVMDTCCFTKYMKNEVTHLFDYGLIRDFVIRNGYWVIITPYTLYECIQQCTSIESIARRKNELLQAGDFWVININSIIDSKYTLEYGGDFIFDLFAGSEDIRFFSEKRVQLREKVYSSLFPRIILLAQLLAMAYVVVLEQDDNDGLSSEAILRLQVIDSFFTNHPNFRIQLKSFLNQAIGVGYMDPDGSIKKGIDAKEYLSVQLSEIINEILFISKIEQTSIIQGEKLNDAEFNAKICAEYYSSKGMYAREEMVKKYRHLIKRGKSVYTIERLLDEAMSKCDPIFKRFYYKAVIDWFSHNGIGKPLMNTLIDYVNLGVLEVDKRFSVIYMTEDKSIAKFALGVDQENIKATREFYKSYCKVSL